MAEDSERTFGKAILDGDIAKLREILGVRTLPSSNKAPKGEEERALLLLRPISASKIGDYLEGEPCSQFFLIFPLHQDFSLFSFDPKKSTSSLIEPWCKDGSK